MIPEAVLRAFIRIYPDLFPSKDLTHLGLLPDPKFGWPVGISRKEVPHLGALPSLGINCAACHVTDFQPLGGGETIRVIGSAAHFDAEAFFGAIVAASFRTSETPNMKRFLGAYLAESNPADAAKIQPIFEAKWKEQEEKVNAVLIANPFGARDIAPGNLHFLAPGSLQMDLMKVQVAEFPGFVELMVKLFHNMRASIHVPDKPPEKLPPSSGPGRSDAFGYLSAVLLGTPAPYAPVKYGILFNLENRPWVHWDGNTRAPVGRNLLASLGLGAPLIGKKALIDFTGMKRHTELTERIRAPKYPFAINEDAAKRGEAHYQAQCARCHDVPEGEARLHAPAEIGTSTHRIDQFTKEMADGFNALIAGLEMPGYEASPFPGIRSTGKLWALSMPGVWARGPFLHNGSVRTMQELLTPSAERPKKQKRGSRTYDPVQMGFTDEGPYELDATLPHNSNAGHEFGTALTPEEKKDLIEFLKTL